VSNLVYRNGTLLKVSDATHARTVKANQEKQAEREKANKAKKVKQN
jgi:hypothetical protein